ncbi:MAG: antibiotic biosynthesis monooxygenase [Cyanobacteria bacterium P01_H01_bin.15]
MSDFQDFLKRKYAYVARVEFKPGKFDIAKQLYDKGIATFSEGFLGAYLLREPGSDRGIAVIFWESLEDMDASRTEAYEALMREMGHLFATAPETTIYEVEEETSAFVSQE